MRDIRFTFLLSMCMLGLSLLVGCGGETETTEQSPSTSEYVAAEDTELRLLEAKVLDIINDHLKVNGFSPMVKESPFDGEDAPYVYIDDEFGFAFGTSVARNAKQRYFSIEYLDSLWDGLEAKRKAVVGDVLREVLPLFIREDADVDIVMDKVAELCETAMNDAILQTDEDNVAAFEVAEWESAIDSDVFASPAPIKLRCSAEYTAQTNVGSVIFPPSKVHDWSIRIEETQ